MSTQARLFRRLALQLLARLAHSHRLLRSGRVHRYGGVEIRFGRPHLYCDPDELNHFGGAFAEDVAADDAIARGVDQQLEKHRGVAPRQGRLHQRDIGFVDVKLGVLRRRLRLRQADRAELRLAEDRRRHIRVVDHGRLAAEHGVGERMAFADRDRRQIDPIGDVADSVDIRNGRTGIFVDRDRSVRVERDPRVFQLQPGDIRRPASANIT